VKYTLLFLALASCSLELPAGTIRPVDEYCLPGTCAAGELCYDGECYGRCNSDSDCASDWCGPIAEKPGNWCIPGSRIRERM
jgi:hypothetical protein